MINRYSVVVDGRVVNHVDATGEFAEAQSWVLAQASLVGDLWDGESYVTPASVLEPLSIPLSVAQARAVSSIDVAVDHIYAVMLGNRQPEYEAAERQASAFADSSYALQPVPGMVQSWATAKGWPAAQAADDILTQAAQWRATQELIRAQRLLRKEQVRSALDADELAAAMQAWSAFVATVRAQLGLVSPAESEAP
ncbi:hypothetical protein LJR118_003265 [Acidovorax sp. LjRoot118]|uniref:hypothetical protein n=1 Tax=Acidovorax sp. LjRoot118 TaxID=3342256 RepID=UPI003ED0B1A0